MGGLCVRIYLRHWAAFFCREVLDLEMGQPDTALRALTSNEHLQEIAREAHVNSLFDGRSSDGDSECLQRLLLLLLLLCPVSCVLVTTPSASSPTEQDVTPALECERVNY
jgi:hypothetical protein